MIEDYIKENLGTSLVGLVLVIILVQSYNPFVFLTNILGIIDTYLKLILTSWPAVILILGGIILSDEEKAMGQRLVKWIRSFFKAGI